MLEWIRGLAPPADLGVPGITTYTLALILLIVVLARTLGSAAARVGQPRVVGEIVAGLLIGPTVLGESLAHAVAPPEVRTVIGVISTLGLLFFTFLAGVEFDGGRVRSRIRAAGVLAGLSVAVPALLAFPLSSALYTEAFAGPAATDRLTFALFLGVILSVTALPVMAHILMERDELNTLVGALGMATAGVVSVMMFIFLGVAAGVASSAATGEGLGLLVTKSLWLIAFLIATVWVVRPVLRWLLPPGLSFTSGHMAVLLAGLLLYGLLGHLLGVTVLVGGFLWGLVIPPDPTLRLAISSRIRDVVMVFLLPVFFASAGLTADLSAIDLSALPAILLVLGAAVAGKFLPMLVGRAWGFAWRDVVKLGALLNTRGLLVIVVGMVGIELGILTPLAFAVTVLVALVTTLMTVPLLSLIDRPARDPARAVLAPAAAPPGPGDAVKGDHRTWGAERLDP